jgi:hypothetical protein
MIGGTDPNDGASLTEAVTAINAALASLQRLGSSDKANALLDQAENISVYTLLDADTEHNQDWLRSAYARKYSSVMTSLASKLTAAASAAATQDQDDASRVYGVKGLAGDPAVLAQYRGAAGQRVADIDLVARPDQLSDLLTNAIRNGDDVLAHAIAEAAIKNGDVDTANAFAAAYPNLSAAVERLWSAEHRSITTIDVTVAWRVAALKPSALGAMQDFEIQAAAAGQTTPGSPTLRG